MGSVLVPGLELNITISRFRINKNAIRTAVRSFNAEGTLAHEALNHWENKAMLSRVYERRHDMLITEKLHKG
jgi:hypothetical protein